MDYIPSLLLALVLENYIYDLCDVIDPCLSLCSSGQDLVASGVVEYIDPLEKESIMLAMTSRTRTFSTVPPTHTVRSTPL